MPARSGSLRARRYATAAFHLLTLGTSWLLPTTANAIETTTIEIAGMAGDGWSVRDLALEIPITSAPDGSRAARLRAAVMTVAGLPEPLTNVAIACPRFTLEVHRVSCAQATVDAVLPTLGRQRVRAALTYVFASGALEMQVEGLVIGDGQARLRGALRDRAWSLALGLQSVRVETLLDLARKWSVSLPGLTGTGTVALDLTARGSGTAIAAVEFNSVFAGLTAANAAGTLASDKLDTAVDGRVERNRSRWDFALRLHGSGGQAYAEPVFLDLGVHALAASATGSRHDDGRIEIGTFSMDHKEVLKARGNALLTPSAATILEQAAIDIERLEFPGAYASYLQPFLLTTGFKNVETAGAVSGKIVIAGGQPRQLDLAIDAVSADDGTGKLALYGLSGDFHWQDASATGEARDSRLELQGGLLLGLEVGTTSLAFRTRSRDLELLGATRIPLLDGTLELDRFAVRDAGLPGMTFALDANLLPVSAQRLSRAFGWPEFGGQLGGRISDLRLDDGVLTLATTLQAQVFDGRLEISNLRMEDPFGDWPRLFSSIDIYNLDLEQVTSAFAFGRITGRLSGYVNEMVLFNWMPVEFDARLFTPPEDRSRHRISQRAVQNIGNLGGGGAGVGAALSSGAMRFFEDFNYDRLGISCRLENEVCLMDGVDPAPQGGYYLVKGRGLPRINVIGNATRVDWPRLVAQIKAITASAGPMVQ